MVTLVTASKVPPKAGASVEVESDLVVFSWFMVNCLGFEPPAHVALVLIYVPPTNFNALVEFMFTLPAESPCKIQ